jgi:hypothetical protein
MIKLICTVFLCLTAWLHIEGQNVEVSGSRIALSDGNVLGATFYEDKGLFFVQQSVLSTETGVRGIRFHRQLSSWDIKSRSMVSTRAFNKAPEGASVFPCGRVETSAKLHRIFLCSAVSHIEVIDPDNLNTVGTMAQGEGQYINDFAVDDLHDRLLVLASRSDGTIYLAVYSLLTGNKQQVAVLPATNGRRMSLGYAPKTGEIGISIEVGGRSEGKADIYACSAESSLVCTNVAQTDAVSQISFLGRQMLVATSTFADNKKDCILAVDLMTRAISRKYCSPSTGVHYAVGVVDNRYVVAFTGVSKRTWFGEENKSVSSTFSVWRDGTSQVVAVAKDPVNYGAFQNEMRVVASSTEPLFIAYQRVSNVLYLYSITEPVV